MNYDSVNNLGGELQSQVRHQKGIKQKVSGNSSARSRAADFVAIVMCQAEQFHKRFVAQKGKHEFRRFAIDNSPYCGVGRVG